ncbi:MAG: DUF523 and DUF1722 domain-containing protein [Acidobacteriota bacterium]|nr:DUF523 and DUF1722 domain-containing protein [Acidobacteriota bacterium]
MEHRPPIRIAVSGCLLGEEVRYDGGHRRSETVAGALGEAFELVSECPEVGIGLGVPRPKIRLEREPRGTRLLGSQGEDLTPLMDDYARQAATRFDEDRVAGIVLKSRSPSCGMGDVKVHRGGAVISEDGTGIFASRLAAAFPETPRISETDLESPARRDHWLTRVFALAEIRELAASSPDARKLYEFHARWKMVLMAHSEGTARRLGRFLAVNRDARDALPRYREEFLGGLAEPASVGTHHNVLLHLAGHLKKPLDPGARKRLQSEIAAFLAREVPLAAPVRSLAAWTARLGVQSLANQAYFAERPHSLAYREGIYRD